MSATSLSIPQIGESSSTSGGHFRAWGDGSNKPKDGAIDDVMMLLQVIYS